MKNIDEHLQSELLDYIDGTLSAQAKMRLEKQLLESESLRHQLKEMRMMHDLMKGIPVDEPAVDFTDQVMGTLQQEMSPAPVSIKNGLLCLTGILLLVTLTYLASFAGVFDHSKLLVDFNQLNFLKWTLPVVSLSGKVVMNIVVFSNIALALVVLDRTILKPLFSRRMNT